MEQVPWARDLACRLLAKPLPVRWAHTKGVGRKAESIAHIVGDKAELLICAAWLHDIGYAPDLANSGFHPLDGARYLRDVEKADTTLCNHVANHSCAAIEAYHRGLAGDLVREFPRPDDLVADALTYCDMTTSPNGEPVTVRARLTEILTRYGAGDVVAESIKEASTKIIAVAEQVNLAISASPREPRISGLESG